MASVPAASSGYDRLSELKAFDATKAGVKGLVDAGVTTVPRIFQDPAAAAAAAQPSSNHHDVAGSCRVPVIDLAAGRADLVAQVKSAAETVGFFQVINHGVPSNLLTEMLASVKSFHEQPAEAKAPYYSRDREPARRVRYQSNFDLYTSPAANWRDSLFMVMTQPVNEVPPPCRAVLPEYTARVRRLGATLLGLLSEAMGLHPGFLEHDAGCLDDGLSVAGHYYPPCPEPHLTMGTTRHSDPSFLTVLLQDDIGGLQMLVNDEDGRGSSSWVDVPPVPGALVVNIGDFLQLVSNDRFKSVEHRVLATAAGPRVSVACFFRTTDGSKVYRPIVNSLEDERPRYRSTTVPEFVGYYMDKGLDGRSKLEHFRLSDDP
ncbi:hypothetical protein QOZ80_9AG0687340 [Eleusine coracana subsp. coracana]|nr:hypothetical protein QOZ80_9AG0687340 [Eleusine coracana subsp. coracana]